ncbi:fumarate and nitrate reduction regulatory protein [mine drainage metagenome]|uniref:Fumarate and nitrate reduction regulatory protein n=1 Tax=mine drainage metagenome TaxID=410659 RepID=A0A1J5RFG4_9ZZZZ
MRRGAPLTHVFVVLDGVVRISRETRIGHTRIVGLALSGDTFACDALASGLYGGDGHAARPTVVAAVDPRLWVDAAARDARLPALDALASVQMARMMRQDSRLRLTAAARVADFLLQLVERRGGGVVELPVSCKDVANHLDLRAETMSRMLRRLAELGGVRRLAPTRFEVDAERLRQIRATH